VSAGEHTGWAAPENDDNRPQLSRLTTHARIRAFTDSFTTQLAVSPVWNSAPKVPPVGRG